MHLGGSVPRDSIDYIQDDISAQVVLTTELDGTPTYAELPVSMDASGSSYTNVAHKLADNPYLTVIEDTLTCKKSEGTIEYTWFHGDSDYDYYRSDTLMPWKLAETCARQMGGGLPVFESALEETILRSKAATLPSAAADGHLG